MDRRPWNDPKWVAPPHPPRRGPVASVKLMVDHGCEMPLWHASWWELSLSPSLLDGLADWQQAFDAGFQPETGWRSDEVAAAWADAAQRLIVRLRHELESGIELEVDLWPLEPVS